jgi:hypothetical protein
MAESLEHRKIQIMVQVREGLATLAISQFIFGAAFPWPAWAQTTNPKSASIVKVSAPQPSYQTLSAMLVKDPKNATAYYMRGCILMKAGNQAALKDFERACQLAPGTRIEQYSKLAVARLTPPAPNQASDQSSDLSQEDASEEPKPKEAAPNSTVALIRKQAEQAHNRELQRGRLEAQEEVAKAENQAKTAQERLQRQAMEAALGKYGGEPRMDPYTFVSPAQVDAFRAQAQATAERVRNLGKLKAGIKEQEGKEKADEIDYQADNLERQLKDDHPLSGIKLNPVGTNLYTRNYALVPPTVKAVRAEALPLPGLHAKNSSGQFNSKATSLNLSRSSLTSQTTDAHGNLIKASVKGQLIPSRKPPKEP